MTRVRPTVAAACAALLLAAPAAAAGSPSQATAVERALAQERAYTQHTNPDRSITADDRARAQERTYGYTPNADRRPVSTATADGGVSTALLAGSIAAGLLLAATGGLAAIAVRRRHLREAAASLPGR